jgi:Fur family ferric uptake transcriptional regulator
MTLPVPSRSAGADLAEQGMAQTRSTRQKRALRQTLSDSDRFRNAAEIYSDLGAAGTSIGLATIYKQLSRLAASGEVDVLRTDDGQLLYRSCSTDSHHHHVVCRRCGRSVEIGGADVEQWANAVAKASGYTEVTHTIEIMGLCRSCRRAQRTAAAAAR